MTALPPGQSAILSSGFSPWQAPLAALFGGLAAAGQPGGWNNFGMGAAQGAQQFQSRMFAQEQAQRAREQFQMDRERFEAEQRRANQEDAQRKAMQDNLRNLLRGQGQSAILGMGQTASAPQDAALFSQYAGDQGIPPHARQAAMFQMQGVPDRVIERGLEADGTLNLNKASEGGIGAGAGPGTEGPNTSQNAGLNIFGHRYNPDQAALLLQMVDSDPDAVWKTIYGNAFAQEQPNETRTRIDGADEVFEQFDPATGDWVELSRGPRWQQQQGPGLTERQRNALAAGLQPGTPEYEQYILGRDDNEGGGPFEGNSMDAQASNILLTGNPASPEYAAAYAHLAQPKVQFDPTTNKLVTVSPDLSWAAKPVQAGASDAPLPLMPSATGNRPGPTIQNAQSVPSGAQAQTDVPGAETMQVPGATITSTPGTGMSAADRTKLRTVRAEADAIRSSLNRFKEVVQGSNWRDDLSAMAGGTTEGGRRLNSAWTNAAIMSKAEALFHLGVLNGPDLQVIEGTLPNPSTLSGFATTEKAYAAAIDEVLSLIDSKVAAYEGQFTDLPGPLNAPNAPNTSPAPGGGTRVDQLPAGNWQ